MCIQFDVLHLLKKHKLNNYGVVCISKIQFLMHQCSLKLEKSILAKSLLIKQNNIGKQLVILNMHLRILIQQILLSTLDLLLCLQQPNISGNKTKNPRNCKNHICESFKNQL